MINRNNGSMFRFFLIFSMNFAWIANVFGSIGLKKELLSVKRVTRSLFNDEVVKKNGLTQTYQFKKTDINDMPGLLAHPAQKKLIPVEYLNIDCDTNLLSNLKKQMLFPHHGFW